MAQTLARHSYIRLTQGVHTYVVLANQPIATVAIVLDMSY
jgi:hypothetical protein